MIRSEFTLQIIPLNSPLLGKIIINKKLLKSPYKMRTTLFLSAALAAMSFTQHASAVALAPTELS